MIKVECSSWFVLVYSVCWKQTESTWDTNQLLPFAVMHLEFFSEKITTILTILLHFWIKTYDKITDTLGKLKPWRDPCSHTFSCKRCSEWLMNVLTRLDFRDLSRYMLFVHSYFLLFFPISIYFAKLGHNVQKSDRLHILHLTLFVPIEFRQFIPKVNFS